MKRLNKPLSSQAIDQPGGSEGGAAEMGDWSVGDASSGGAAGLFNWLGGFKKAAGNLLNFATYYQMKQRAGKVGMQGLNPLLKKIHQQLPQLKLHLMDIVLVGAWSQRRPWVVDKCRRSFYRL